MKGVVTTPRSMFCCVFKRMNRMANELISIRIKQKKMNRVLSRQTPSSRNILKTHVSLSLVGRVPSNAVTLNAC